MLVTFPDMYYHKKTYFTYHSLFYRYTNHGVKKVSEKKYFAIISTLQYFSFYYYILHFKTQFIS